MSTLPNSFLWRRLHSLSGVFLVLFLIFHLITNSQAALWLGDDGGGFVHEVNLIHSLPYLVIVEILLLGVPFLIHMIWGVSYLFTSEPNSSPSDGSKPAFPEYPRNKAYTWQRITSWFLLFAVAAHVIHMRIYNYPSSAQLGDEKAFMQRVSIDPGLYTVAARLGVTLVDKETIDKEKAAVSKGEIIQPVGFNPQVEVANQIPADALPLLKEQRQEQQKSWIEALEERPLSEGQLIAITPNFGTATLLLVRDSFKDPILAIIYTFFVLAACYHAFNGLWTAMITWGVTLNPQSQRLSQTFCVGLMLLLTLLGLTAIWGTYFLNLRT